MFFGRIHFAKSDVIAIGHEDWVISEPICASLWKNKAPVNRPFEHLFMAIRPSEDTKHRQNGPKNRLYRFQPGPFQPYAWLGRNP